MRAKEFTFEAAIGTHPKRPAREGSRPDRGHNPEARYTPAPAKPFRNPPGFNKQGTGVGNKLAQLTRKEQEDNKKKEQDIAEMESELAEHGKASRELCKSSKSDADLGASMLASCKSQGLRARDGNKSHKLGKGPESRVKVGGHKLKGKKYGGKLPDWS